MAALALIDVLKDFAARPFHGEDAPRPSAMPARTPQPVVVPTPDIGQIVAEEVARAEAALEERLAFAQEAALEVVRQNHAAEIDALHTQLGEKAGAIIAARLAEMEARVADLATSATARIVGAILTSDIQKRSVDSLAASIREAMGDAEAMRIQVRGPQSLFEALRSALGDRAGNLDYAEGPAFDLTVTIDGNLFETRLSEWSAAISEVLS